MKFQSVLKDSHGVNTSLRGLISDRLTCVLHLQLMQILRHFMEIEVVQLADCSGTMELSTRNPKAATAQTQILGLSNCEIRDVSYKGRP